MIGIPLGLAYSNFGEWMLHRYVLHGLGRKRESFWSFHWHEHHQRSRRNEMVDEQYRGPMEASHRALRLVEALRQAGRHDEVARFYTELGTRVHERGETLTVEVVRAAAEATGLRGEMSALDDAGLDAAVRASTDAALAAAGPGVGSPVVLLPDTERGLHGPVLDEVPAGKDALALWDAMETLIRLPAFYEVKRGRQ